ncbi:hypothetical protein MVEN_02031600 [Mycena venus]|uniref:Elongin-A n=1 Tax=Mycena venus TaxID=2733690 RepID=A0A8H6XCM6_9AGAR|nr:hypothetical protein MVEN_02031600 [Mycena venus]
MALPDDRVPTLVQYCQRVAAVHVDAISSVGDELRYDLVKPILERCTVDQLLRLEQASPYLKKDTPEIWKALCFRTYPTATEGYHRGEILEPESWRDQYFVLVEEEARRIEEVGLKIRRQRQEAEERKKEQEIKITTQLPHGKRRCKGVFRRHLKLYFRRRNQKRRGFRRTFRRGLESRHRQYRCAPDFYSRLNCTQHTGDEILPEIISRIPPLCFLIIGFSVFTPPEGQQCILDPFLVEIELFIFFHQSIFGDHVHNRGCHSISAKETPADKPRILLPRVPTT